MKTIQLSTIIDVDVNLKINDIAEALENANQDEWFELLENIDSNASIYNLFKALLKDIERCSMDYREVVDSLNENEIKTFQKLFNKES